MFWYVLGRFETFWDNFGMLWDVFEFLEVFGCFFCWTFLCFSGGFLDVLVCFWMI